MVIKGSLGLERNIEKIEREEKRRGGKGIVIELPVQLGLICLCLISFSSTYIRERVFVVVSL